MRPDRVKAHKIVRAPKAQVGVSIKSDLLALDISSEAFSSEELSEILGAYQKKKTYYRLKSGEPPVSEGFFGGSACRAVCGAGSFRKENCSTERSRCRYTARTMVDSGTEKPEWTAAGRSRGIIPRDGARDEKRGGQRLPDSTASF